MSRSWRHILVGTGLILAFASARSWAQVPITNDASDANFNTGGGSYALVNNTGTQNTAYGFETLFNNTEGYYNTATGSYALSSNTTGTHNTATGTAALSNNTRGNYNAALGYGALGFNRTGYDNVASGFRALVNNATGSANTALGSQALSSNSKGNYNTATGGSALSRNTTGYRNTATGFEALFSNKNGTYNTVLGYRALYNLTAGSRNTALGYKAGFHLESGDSNIYLGNTGFPAESNIMRLGQALNQTRTFIAGIADVGVDGSPVVIDSNGQLGIVASSARYKRDIQPMGASSQKVHQLRPVTFRYKKDPQRQRQYGLVAEEVAAVYPELVVRGAKGEVMSVQYHELIPMLLNEVQHQQREIEELKARLERLEPGLAKAR